MLEKFGHPTYSRIARTMRPDQLPISRTMLSSTLLCYYSLFYARRLRELLHLYSKPKNRDRAWAYTEPWLRLLKYEIVWLAQDANVEVDETHQ